MIKTFLSSLGSKFLMTLLVGSTILTTGVAISKVSNSFARSEIPVKGINIEAAEKVVEPAGIVTKIVTPIIRAANRVIPTLVPTAFPAAVVPTKTSTVNNNQCIVTISGTQYDVTRLRTTHSGGDVFKCGTDMTSAYQGKHGTNMSRMQAYLINNVNSNASNSPTIPTSIQKAENNDDRQDFEHEDRYVKDEDHDEKDED